MYFIIVESYLSALDST